MNWYYDGKVLLKDKRQFYILASGTVSRDDFEIDDLVAYKENGDQRLLTEEEDNDIVEWLIDRASDFYEQALGTEIDDAYDLYNDR